MNNSVELVPFRAAVDAGVGAVMDGHIGLPLIDPTAITPLPREVNATLGLPGAETDAVQAFFDAIGLGAR